MKTTLLSLIAAATLVASPAFAVVYNGNGNTGFGGPIGTATLTLTDDGTTVSGTINRTSGSFNDVLVLYIDSTAGGFGSTLSLGDGADGLRKAISGFDGGANRSTLTFAGGFSPDYAIALGPQSDGFGGLWQLAAGGGGSLNFVSSVSLSPTGGGSGSSSSFSFSFNVGSIGLTANSGQGFGIFGTYISNTGFRSDEALPGNLTGSQGWNPFSQQAFETYYIVPEPSVFSLVGLGAAALFLRRRRK